MLNLAVHTVTTIKFKGHLHIDVFTGNKEVPSPRNFKVLLSKFSILMLRCGVTKLLL
jgi:hypothetical protein